MDILYFFESIRNPVLDKIVLLMTELGSEVGFLAAALIFFWCVDKRQGYYIMSVGFLGVIINQIMKILFMIPRPWIKDPTFKPVEGSVEGAGGYSFPSGHTQNATGTFGSIALIAKKNWLRILSVAIIIIIPLTRMYLGVHTLVDVSVSLIIGAVLVLALYPLFEYTKKNPNFMYILLGIFFILSIGFTLFAHLWRFPADIDAENLYELRKNAATLLGATAGVFFLYPVERKFIDFDVKAPLVGQIVKVIVGLGAVVGVKEGLKTVFKLLGNGTEALWLRSVRYFIVVAVAMAVYPLLFKFFAKIGKKKES